MNNLINILFSAATLQCLFLSSLYFFSKKYEGVSNKLLSLFLVALLVEAINSFLPFDYIGTYYIRNYFSLPESKLFFPVLFLHYILRKLGQEKNYKAFLLVCYGLGFLVLVLTLANLLIFMIYNKSLYDFLGYDILNTIFMIQQIIAFILTMVVFVIAKIEMRLYKKMIQNNFSDFGLLQIKWTEIFVNLMLFSAILWGVELLRIAFSIEGFIENVVVINWIFLFIAILFISYKTFSSQELFIKDRFEILQQTKESQDDLIDSDVVDEMMSKIDAYMQKHESFRNTSLNLHDFSKEIGYSTRKISNAINSCHQTNFSDWVNRYRIDLAIKMLASQSNLTIEGIGNEAGFRTRSAMYLAFKKIKGKTPGDFKK